MDRQLWNGFIMTQKEKFLKIFLLFFLCAYIICQVAQTRLVDRAHLQVTRNKSLPHPHVRLMELLWYAAILITQSLKLTFCSLRFLT